MKTFTFFVVCFCVLISFGYAQPQTVAAKPDTSSASAIAANATPAPTSVAPTLPTSSVPLMPEYKNTAYVLVAGKLVQLEQQETGGSQFSTSMFGSAKNTRTFTGKTSPNRISPTTEFVVAMDLAEGQNPQGTVHIRPLKVTKAGRELDMGGGMRSPLKNPFKIKVAPLTGGASLTVTIAKMSPGVYKVTAQDLTAGEYMVEIITAPGQAFLFGID